MSYKQKREISLFLFIVNVAFYKFQICSSASVLKLDDLNGFPAYQGKASTTSGLENIKPKNDAQQTNTYSGGRVTLRGAPKSDNPGLEKRPSQSAVFLGKPLNHVKVPKLQGIDNNLAHKATDLSWTFGDASAHQRPRYSDTQGGYQSDFAGFQGVQGKVSAPSFDSSPYLSEWLAMRPFVQCDNNIMIFTATGQGYTHLFVDREDASPISLFQLPPYCRYSVKTSWSDLVMMAPYDGCYITQENGSYVLPMLWWDSPMKLSCPVQTSTPDPSPSTSAPLIFCSPYGMTVQIHGEEKEIPALAVMVNGGWAPFASAECAYHVDSQPEELTFFTPFSAPCVTVEDGLHLVKLLNGQEFTISCPVVPSFYPNFPSPPYSPPLSPSDPQYPYPPPPVSPPPTTPPPPPQPPTQGQVLQLPDFFHYPYPGLQYPQLPQAYPPGPQPARPSLPPPGGPPGPQSQQSLDPMGSGQMPYSPGYLLHYPSLSYQPSVAVKPTSFPTSSSGKETPPNHPHPPKLPVGPPQYFPYVPLYYPLVTPAPIPGTQKPTASFLAPVTQGPATFPPAPHPLIPPDTQNKPMGPQYPQYLPNYYGSFHPPGSYNPYGSLFYPKPGPDAWSPSPSPSPPPTTTTTSTTRTMVPQQPVGPHYSLGPHYPPGSYDPYNPIYFHPLTPPPPKGALPSSPRDPWYLSGPLDSSTATVQPPAPGATCPPHAHTLCSYYPYPYYHPAFHQQYHPFYPPVSVDQSPTTPETQPTPSPSPSTNTTIPTPSSSVASTPTQAPPLDPSLRCLLERMMVLLPSAHPDSIQVREERKTWLSLSSVSPLCKYMLQVDEGYRVIFHSPLPACHGQQRTPTTHSLRLRFWDMSMEQHRTLELRCPYQPTPEIPAPSTPTTIPPSVTATHFPVPRPRIFCSSLHMTVELPPGPMSGIVLKDVHGNEMELQVAPEHCGYSASTEKDGKIILNFPFSSNCHMSVQGKEHVISVAYMTATGRRGAKLSCPVSVPQSSQECNLPGEQRLPCGPGSLAQAQCLSVGCCFSERPPACYYPMDECTLDRHFIFSVPASLTDPPLSPSLLVAAGNSTCKPQKVAPDYALFKIPMDDCGTRRLVMDRTVIYMVEILNVVQTITLNYGTITRDSPVRLLVECRYLPGSVVTVGYMVKTPSLGSSIDAQGVFGVQLRIAKDAEYSSYYPQYHQPLQMLLGKSLYLEVRLLNPPDHNLVLLVHYCVAYPRSGQAVWVLLYNGCPNPLDPAAKHTVLSSPPPPSPLGLTRRFNITTFQFLQDGKPSELDEEIYFMCSTEVCSPLDAPCVEGCFGQ